MNVTIFTIYWDTIKPMTNIKHTVLCLERGIAGFPRFYRRCPLKRTQRGPKGAPRKSANYFSLFSTISVFSVT